MVLKLYEYSKKEKTYCYVGGYSTFNGIDDLSKYLGILLCNLYYDKFTIDYFVDIRGYSTNDFKLAMNDNARLCMFKTFLNGVSFDYMICLGKED